MNRRIQAFLSGAAVLVTAMAGAQTVCTWTGGAGDGKWSSAGNWDANGKPVVDRVDGDGKHDKVILTNSGESEITIDNDISGLSLETLMFAAGSGPIKLTGNRLTLCSNDGGTVTEFGDEYGQVSALYSAADAMITIDCDLALPAGTKCFTIKSSDSAYVLINGEISGSGGIHRRPTFNGGASARGTLELAGYNMFTGGGTLRCDKTVLSHISALGSGNFNLFGANQIVTFDAEGDWANGIYFLEGPLTIAIGKSCRFLSPVAVLGTAWHSAVTIYGNAAVTVQFMDRFGCRYDTVDMDKGATGMYRPLDRYQFFFDFPARSAIHFYGKAQFGAYMDCAYHRNPTSGANVRGGFGLDNDARKGWDVHFHEGSAAEFIPGSYKSNFVNTHIYYENFFEESEQVEIGYARHAWMNSYYFHGVNQQAGALWENGTAYNLAQDREKSIYAEGGACTLTLHPTNSASAGIGLQGPLSIVYESKDGDFTQIISNRTCNMTGSITVSNGTFCAKAGTSFKNVPRINIDGGRFQCESTVSESLQKAIVNIGANGVLGIAAGAANPFGENAAINIEAGGTIDLGANLTIVVPVNYDGDYVYNNWSYQAKDGTDPNADKVDWITGAGVLSVEITDIRWKSATSGDWYNPENWTPSMIPGYGDTVKIQAESDCDYTVSMYYPVDLGTLEISRTDVGKAALEVRAAFTLGEEPEAYGNTETGTSGAMMLGKGAKVELQSGGSLHFYTKDSYSTTKWVELKDGAEFKVNGGEFFATNYSGTVAIGDNQNNVTSTFKVASGTASIFTRNSTDSRLHLYKNGKIDISGGVLRLVGEGTSRIPLDSRYNGTIEVSGDGRLELGQGQIYLSGYNRFSGNAQLAPYIGKSGGTIYLSPVDANSPAVLEFTDHAGIDPTGAAVYSGFEGGYMFGRWTMGNNVPGGSTRVLFHSDAKYMLGQGAVFGLHRGNAYGSLTDGLLISYSGGISVGESANADTGVAPDVNATFVQDGGVCIVRAGDCTQSGTPNVLRGFTIGINTRVYAGREGFAAGRYELNGGSLTNMSWQSMTAVGSGLAKGEFVQNGGEFIRTDNGYFVVGMLGGDGSWIMTNGTARVENIGNLYIGGAYDSDFGRTLVSPPVNVEGLAKGLLRIHGGSFTANRSTVTVGKDGIGKVEIGPTGQLNVKAVEFLNSADAPAKSSLGFTFGASGVGTLTTTEGLTVGSGTKLVVDLSACTTKGNYTLVAGPVNGSFAQGDITLLGTQAQIDAATLTQTDNGITLRVRGTSGSMLIFK